MTKRIHVIFITSIFTTLFFSSFSSLAGDEANKYEITIDKSNPLIVHVSAELLIDGDTLFMNSNCPNYDYPEGWSTFVKNLKITTPKGKAVLFEYVSKSKWLIERNKSKILFLNYDIDQLYLHNNH